MTPPFDALLESPPLESKSHTLSMHEIRELASQKRPPEETLNEIVQLIRKHVETEVCSVYLLEPDRTTLVLGATIGLRSDSVGKVRMRLDEGLAGLAAEQLRPVMVEDAFLHPRFKYFRESGEEAYRSFLGVPLLEQGMIQGVLVVQTVESRVFSRDEIAALALAAQQIAPIVSEVRTLDQFIAPIYRRIWAIAKNVWWSWDNEATSLFRELDPIRWRELDHNPIAFLSEISLAELEKRASQQVLHSRVHYTYRRMREYLQSTQTWGAEHCGVLHARPVAYFSAEFGLHESIPIYSGGLGILAGDHVKSASDLGVPLVAIGLFYDQGYFRQRLDLAGWQHEDYLDTDVKRLPLEPMLGKDNRPVFITIPTRNGLLNARVWKIAVGRNLLLLLDTDVEGNASEDRELTARLYGGDLRVRIRQELLLGVGGVKVLSALGIVPGVLHLNEGHSAFAALEMTSQRMIAEGINFDEARARVTRQTVFTTHTPVPAGHDRFPAALIEEHLGPLRDAMAISHDRLLGLGRVNVNDMHEPFCMTVLALKFARRANAVSSLHGEVSRAMWTTLWTGRPEDEVPIGHVTNGIHVPTWLAPQMRQLYDRHLGPDWARDSAEPDIWKKTHSIDDGELWETHQVLKARLLGFVRSRAIRQAKRRGESDEMIDRCQRSLSMDALTIGFARRFATYKRADLLFRDIEQIAALINDPQIPIQLVFAGKAHPQDIPGKQILQRIAEFARSPQFLGKIVFVEDYDMNVGRHLVQGVDIWLNNPRRPLEASGTSGQKVILNGGLNLSVLDGWWAEAYDGTNGFAIGHGLTHSSMEQHDRMDSDALYKTLIKEVIPLYYQRDKDGLPRGWIARMKSAIHTLGWRFSADRMVRDYVLKCYLPAAGGLSSDMGTPG